MESGGEGTTASPVTPPSRVLKVPPDFTPLQVERGGDRQPLMRLAPRSAVTGLLWPAVDHTQMIKAVPQNPRGLTVGPSAALKGGSADGIHIIYIFRPCLF